MPKVKIPKNKKLDNLKAGKKAKHGGKREGSGRKSKKQIEKLTRQAARARFNNWVDKHWHLLEEKCLEYVMEGDKNFILFMINQRIGTAPKTLELGNENDMPLQIVIKKEDGNDYKL